MLKLFRPQSGSPLRQPGTLYWSEAVAVIPLTSTHWLGSHSAPTPRLALRWLHSRANDVADQLDASSAAPIRHWLQDHQEHELALRTLAAGHPYTFTAFEDTTRDILTARPTLGLATNDGSRHRNPGRHRAQDH